MNKYRKDMQEFEKALKKIMSDVDLEQVWDWSGGNDACLFEIAEAYEEKVRLENEDKLTLH
jgi:hypothetical protein|tara:strand:- start:1224 stop:1406 length:183 start_codon:yes stop_codon:yes gene_type:complete